MHRVVRPFPVSWNGLTLIDLRAGDEREFGDMTAGLLAEGYIEPTAAAVPVVVPAPEPVVVPAPADEPVVVPVVEATAPTPATEHKRPYKKRK